MSDLEAAKVVFGILQREYSGDHAGEPVDSWAYTFKDEDYLRLGLNIADGKQGLYLLVRKHVIKSRELTPAGLSYGLTSIGEGACNHPDTIERILTYEGFKELKR